MFYEEAIQAPDADRNYPGKLEVWEDEDPTKAVELFLLKAEKEILKNRTTWDAQHERWEKNRTKNVALAQETQDIARRRGERDKALIQINELDWLLDNHTLSEPMRVPTGWCACGVLPLTWRDSRFANAGSGKSWWTTSAPCPA